MKIQEITAFVAGLLIGVFVFYFALNDLPFGEDHDMMSLGNHPVGYADNEDKVHVHSDFVLFLDGAEVDLSADKYQSKTAQILHAHVHLHDNNDEVIHRHDHGVTLGDFFESLGFALTEDCITDDTEREFCSDDTEELMVFVNDERIESPFDYVNEEEDRILIYHGPTQDTDTIRSLLMSITDTACIYSGTCPERGVAPPESCGLTCEL